MIQPKKKKVKLHKCEKKDRISDLPDCIILHILSFLNAEHAVRTCVLSTRWKHLWKHLPALIFDSANFPSLKFFTNFVSRVLSLRDSSIALHTLDFERNGRMEPHLLKRIVNYAISHNVQRLELNVRSDIEQIPHKFFSCQTLTHLKLAIYSVKGFEQAVFPTNFNLPSLISLHIQNFVFCGDGSEYVEPLLAFNKLNSLVLYGCDIRDAKVLRVSSTTLVKLTLHNHSHEFYIIELCTPSLRNFAFTGTPYQTFSKNSLSSVKHVDINAEILSIDVDPPLFLLSWLVGFSNIKSLTVSATTLQVLSLYPDFLNLLNIKLPALATLKSLKVKTKPLEYGFRMALCDVMLGKVKSLREAAKLRKAYAAGLEPYSPIPDGIIDFLIQNTPLAEVEIIDCSRQKAQSTS